MIQHTVADALDFAGVGLHTGADARMIIRPQPANAGISFRLGRDGEAFAATSDYVVETRLATVLGAAGRTVSTVEHVLSGLFAMGVDNALIEVEGPEIPILDGSSAPYVAALQSAGIVEQSADRRSLSLEHPLVFRDGDAIVALVPASAFRVRMGVDFAQPIGAEVHDVNVEPGAYAREIAPARTFGYMRDVEALRAAGLARGGSLENALVFGEDGPLSPLRLPSEVVRHKMLDLIGDFALLGAWPQFEVLAFKSGHRLHAQAVAALRGEGSGVRPSGA